MMIATDMINTINQITEYFISYTIGGMDFLMYMAALKGLIKTQAKRRANELLELVSLQGDAHKKIKIYSGGMKHIYAVKHYRPTIWF